jgi:polyisoprenoid-binding protein YceI
MKKLNLLIGFLIAGSAAFAQTTWVVDNVHSKIGFIVTHMAVSEVEGKFNEYEAAVISKSDDFNGAEVTFKSKTASIDTDNEKRDGHLKSPDFFDAEKFPEITFKGNLVKVSAGKYKLKGDFTMKGVTKQVEFDVTGGQQVNTGRGIKSGFKFTSTINRQDYGLTWANKVPTGELVVADEVVLNIKVELDKK